MRVSLLAMFVLGTLWGCGSKPPPPPPPPPPAPAPMPPKADPSDAKVIDPSVNPSDQAIDVNGDPAKEG